MRTLCKTGAGGRSRRGAAMLFALLVALTMAAMAAALLITNLRTQSVRVEFRNGQSSFYAAEAGLSDAYMRMSNGLVDLNRMPAMVGSEEDPVSIGPMSYWVEIDAVGARSFALRSTGLNDGNDHRLELILDRIPTGFFRFAAFGSEAVRLESNAFIDSYDSTLGPYASQVQGGNAFALENGNVGSNKDVVLRSNTEIHGDCRPGPGGVLDASAPGTYISGSTEPAEEIFVLPAIEVPSIPSSGSFVASSDLVLGPGLVHYDALRVQGGTTLTIVGPATVVLDDYQMKSGASMIFDATAGEIDIHGTGDFVLESNTKMKTLSNSAVDLTILLSGDNMSPGARDRIELSSNAEFVGAIYAPNIAYRLGSNFNVYGSIICGRLALSSNGEIHFDETLLYDDEDEDVQFAIALWQRLASP